MTDPLVALKALFVQRCEADLAVLLEADERRDMVETGRVAHRLAGSAGSFGFPEISRLALIVDEGCRDAGRPPDGSVDDLTTALRDALGGARER